MSLLAVIASALATSPATAAASGGEDKAKILGPVKKHDDGTATVRARYTCDTGEMLWVSAKQTASGDVDRALEGWGSSRLAAAWLETHTVAVECDGRQHVGTFTINNYEQGHGDLVRGSAWLQFCLTDPSAGPEEEGLVISESRWVKVV